jgi:hypothetical protein
LTSGLNQWERTALELAEERSRRASQVGGMPGRLAWPLRGQFLSRPLKHLGSPPNDDHVIARTPWAAAPSFPAEYDGLEGRADRTDSRMQTPLVLSGAADLLADRPKAVIWLNAPGRGINIWW